MQVVPRRARECGSNTNPPQSAPRRPPPSTGATCPSARTHGRQRRHAAPKKARPAAAQWREQRRGSPHPAPRPSWRQARPPSRRRGPLTRARSEHAPGAPDPAARGDARLHKQAQTRPRKAPPRRARGEPARRPQRAGSGGPVAKKRARKNGRAAAAPWCGSGVTARTRMPRPPLTASPPSEPCRSAPKLSENSYLYGGGA